MTVQTWIGGLAGIAAVIEDLSSRRISNWTTGGAALGGLLWHFGQRGWRGACFATFGAVAGFSIFLIFYLMGGMGGGDLKLMGGFGSLLGAGQILQAALVAAIVGGLLAVAATCATRRLGRPAVKAIPYAPAIVTGAWIIMFSRM